MRNSSDIIYRYWGKARPDDEEAGPAYHLLPMPSVPVIGVISRGYGMI
jgi:CRISPR-associated endonuclease/helicase Cas3